ncbi:MAG: hypothetical protein ACFCBU_07905 [Cyanophyceae cyanobacterium]
MPLRKKRDPVWVLTPARKGGPNIHYGFQTPLPGTDGADLGHVTYQGNEAFIVWFGANAPKPARYAKNKATGVVTSYCGVDSISAAIAAKWSEVASAEFDGPGESTKTQLVGIDMGNGENYCWNMDKGDFGDYGGSMGIELVTGTTEIIRGASRPKPQRVYQVSAGADPDTQRVQTSFIKPGQDPPAGWKFMKGTGKGLDKLP